MCKVSVGIGCDPVIFGSIVTDFKGVLVLQSADLASCILFLLTEHLQFANCSLCSYVLLQIMHCNLGVGVTFCSGHVVFGMSLATSCLLVPDKALELCIKDKFDAVVAVCVFKAPVTRVAEFCKDSVDIG